MKGATPCGPSEVIANSTIAAADPRTIGPSREKATWRAGAGGGGGAAPEPAPVSQAADPLPRAVQSTPRDERPPGAVPQAAEQHRDHDVHRGADLPATAAAD